MTACSLSLQQKSHIGSHWPHTSISEPITGARGVGYSDGPVLRHKEPRDGQFCLSFGLRTKEVAGVGWDFPGGPVVKNPPSNAGDVGSIPAQGTKITHVTGQLSPRATTKTQCSQNK